MVCSCHHHCYVCTLDCYIFVVFKTCPTLLAVADIPNLLLPCLLCSSHIERQQRRPESVHRTSLCKLRDRGPVAHLLPHPQVRIQRRRRRRRRLQGAKSAVCLKHSIRALCPYNRFILLLHLREQPLVQCLRSCLNSDCWHISRAHSWYWRASRQRTAPHRFQICQDPGFGQSRGWHATNERRLYRRPRYASVFLSYGHGCTVRKATHNIDSIPRVRAAPAR